MTRIQAVYERGILRPLRKLPLREHAHVTLIVQLNDPVSRTRGVFHVPRQSAKVLIYEDTLLDS